MHDEKFHARLAPDRRSHNGQQDGGVGNDDCDQQRDQKRDLRRLHRHTPTTNFICVTTVQSRKTPGTARPVLVSSRTLDKVTVKEQKKRNDVNPA